YLDVLDDGAQRAQQLSPLGALGLDDEHARLRHPGRAHLGANLLDRLLLQGLIRLHGQHLTMAPSLSVRSNGPRSNGATRGTPNSATTRRSSRVLTALIMPRQARGGTGATRMSFTLAEYQR